MSSASGVFVKDKEFGWLPASILSTNGVTAQVSVKIPIKEEDGIGESFTKEERSIQLKDYEDATLPLQNIDEGGNAIVAPDMCDLHSLHEAAILYNLKERHASQHPYTRVGDIVIAMNPFQVSAWILLRWFVYMENGYLIVHLLHIRVHWNCYVYFHFYVIVNLKLISLFPL